MTGPAKKDAPTDALADRAADVDVSPPTVLAKGFHDLVRYCVALRTPDGETLSSVRDVLRVGKVTAVLPIDLKRGELVLIRQFRLPAHLATGRGELIEIVAGHVEAGETPAEAAMRECVEEIGVRPKALYEMLEFIPVPGSSDEHATLFLGLVDATGVPERAGADDEKESTQPMRIAIDAAIAALGHRTMQNGFLIIALQWLALHRDKLDTIVAGSPAGR
jgi:ADP-ribose pyrophosphatase